MKLIIQIPCLNEEATLPVTIADLPKSIEGIDEIEIMIIDDGSTDRTVDIAKECGAHHILSFPKNKGLAYAFNAGLDACIKLGADIIVNTDADNQYKGPFIADLVRPILSKRADIVIGCRPIESIEDFSAVKKFLQRLGSRVVQFFSRIEVPDVTSGFRAFSKTSAAELNIVSRFSYTVESIIQAGHRSMSIACVPVETNRKTRESRLFRSMSQYIFTSVGIIVRIYTQYRPLRTFWTIGFISLALGLIPSIRFLYLFFMISPEGHVQSLILSAILLLFGAMCCLFGLLADQVARNRFLIEGTLARVKDLQLSSGSAVDRIPYLIHSVRFTKK